MRSAICFALLVACATASPPLRLAGDLWPGETLYRVRVNCAALAVYEQDVARTWIDEAVVELVPGLVYPAVTYGNFVRIRAETTIVQREALMRHEATHWLEARRTGRTIYYPACKTDQTFLDWEQRLEDALRDCR